MQNVAACPCVTPCSALLATQPATGYELAGKFDASLANAWNALAAGS